MTDFSDKTIPRRMETVALSFQAYESAGLV